MTTTQASAAEPPPSIAHAPTTRRFDVPRASTSVVDAVVVVVLLVAAYLIRRLALPTDGLAFDDSWVVVGATKAGPSDLLDVSTNHPGFTLGLMMWARAVSTRTELFAWIPLIFGVLAPAATYLVAARSLRISRLVAAAAGAVLLIAPEHAIYSGRVKPYVIGTLVTIGLTAAVPWLAGRRWTWSTAVAWTAAAVVAGSIEALTLVVTAVAMLILAAHPVGDRKVRLGALVAQGACQLALLVTVQGRFASSTIAEEWETTYDGYLELDAGPVSVVRQIAAHLARLGQNLVPGSKAVGLVVIVLALAGLGWRSWRGSQRIAARFLLALFGVSFLGGLVRQIPFGPSVGNPVFPGGRASLWMLPAILFGLAWAVDGIRSLLARRQPALGPAVGAVALAGAVLLAGIHADDPRTYPMPGMGGVARHIRAVVDENTMVITLPTAGMTLAAEPGIPVRVVPDRDNHQGFDIAWSDPRWVESSVAVFPNRFRASLQEVDRVVVVNGLIGYGDAGLPDIEAILEEVGFRHLVDMDHVASHIDVWQRG